MKTLAAAIRKEDKRHLVTVGLVDWSLDRPGLTSGFVPKAIADDLDFLCVHLYPETGKVDEAIETLKGFAVGKPVVIEETFPLKCSREEFEDVPEEVGGARGRVGRLLLGQAAGGAAEVEEDWRTRSCWRGWRVFEKRGKSWVMEEMIRRASRRKSHDNLPAFVASSAVAARLACIDLLFRRLRSGGNSSMVMSLYNTLLLAPPWTCRPMTPVASIFSSFSV